MEIVRTISWMKETVRQLRAENHITGFIPTMGALHEGHLSLTRRAKTDCSRVIASIFLNPAQFGPGEDLTKYPRTFDADVQKLESAGVDFLFAPNAQDIYPADFKTYVTVEGLSDRLEGKSRPGHFRGVATVVLKLFEIVQPSLSFFGRKDAQQVRILQQMAKDLNLATEIVVCPIVRETDGLALSSRNVYLTTPERAAATILRRALEAVRQDVQSGSRDTLQLQGKLRSVLSTEPMARVDYAEIVDAESFAPLTNLANRNAYVLLAVYIGKTRLIDNLLITSGENGEVVSLL